jgi:hypothetical protein
MGCVIYNNVSGAVVKTTDHKRKVTPMPTTAPAAIVSSSKAASTQHKIHLNYVSRHATERYREAHPNALFDDLIAAFEAGTQIDYEIVIPLTGRHVRRPSDPKCERFSTYVLCPDRLGLFVVKEGALVTYIRLGMIQAEWAAKWYPVKRRAAVASAS